MATPFSEVFDVFISNITDYSLASLDESDYTEELRQWLLASIPMFPNPKSELTNYDLINNSFNIDLVFEEKQILGKMMVLQYMNTYLFREEYLKQSLNSKDYNTYSPANQLKSLREIKEHINSEINTLISRYSWNIKNLKNWLDKT